MARKISSRTHVFSTAFNELCFAFGPDKSGNQSIAKIVCRNVRSVRDWRSGLKACPRWAYELVRLTLDERHCVLEQMTGKYKKLKFSNTRLTEVCVAIYGNYAANDSVNVIELPVNIEG